MEDTADLSFRWMFICCPYRACRNSCVVRLASLSKWPDDLPGSVEESVVSVDYSYLEDGLTAQLEESEEEVVLVIVPVYCRACRKSSRSHEMVGDVCLPALSDRFEGVLNSLGTVLCPSYVCSPTVGLHRCCCCEGVSGIDSFITRSKREREFLRVAVYSSEQLRDFLAIHASPVDPFVKLCFYV